MKTSRILTLICTAALALPAAAAADVPAGNSGGDQYTPSIPGAHGDQEERDFTGSDEQTDANLPDSIADELQSRGDAGAAAAAAAAATTPDSAALERAKLRRAEGADGAAQGERGTGTVGGSPDASTIASAGLADPGDDRIGIAFPVALGLSLIVGLVLLARRRIGGG